MEQIALANINSFGPRPEEPVFVLTATQLQEIVQNALESKSSSIQAEILALREEVALERATDRRRIAELERGHIQPMQADRGEILRALLAANGGKMLAKEARHKMHLSESRFSELLTSCEECIGKKALHTNKRLNVIFLK
jgi:hypothetical protein